VNEDVKQAIKELEETYSDSSITTVDDGQGGAHVFVETVDLGPGFEPRTTWMGGHIPALYPNADIYPVFIGAEVRRADGKAFVAPVTNGSYQGRAAWQVSRANHQIHLAPQTAVMKWAKVRHFLETLP
jgi:hypothetical protein